MKHASAALAAVLFLSFGPAAAQAPVKATPKPVPTQKQSGGGLTVQSGPEAPKGAVPAEMEDLRLLPDASDPFALERLGLGAVQANDLGKARIFFEKSWKLGGLPTAAYNVACLDAREKKPDAAFASLGRALGAGFDDVTALRSDSDLESLRSSPRWKGVLDRAEKNRIAGDAAVVKEGIFVSPGGRPVGLLVLLHDAASSPMAVSAPFVGEAKKRGLFLAVPRGPGRSAAKRFGWGSAERAASAVDAAVGEGRRRAGDTKLPVLLLGVGRGGTEALSVAARKSAGTFAGVGSINGPFDPGAARQAPGLRGALLFLGISQDADPAKMGAFRRGVDALKQMGLAPVVREWPGTGQAFPRDPAKAASDVLDGFGVPAGT
jgi:hypothetical protein